ncbi:MAG: hypothetical protein ACRCR2_03720 [Fusobacteriaceae bacterium]
MRWDVSDLAKGLADISTKTYAALDLYGETASKKFEAYAKENYPWTNRSFMASKTLHGSHEWLGKTLRVKIEHGMEYGVYLEYCNGGKYAILWPTIESQSSKAMLGLNQILRR